jgi:glycosyltransferase involved in cell wall biosynthesis
MFEEVQQFFQRATVVVLPYLDATQSGIIPTAYMYKRAVVATKVGSIPEVVDHEVTGILIEPGNEKSLAEAVIRLLLDPNLRTSMGEAGYQKLQQELSWKSIAGKTLQVYESALNQNSR